MPRTRRPPALRLNELRHAGVVLDFYFCGVDGQFAAHPHGRRDEPDGGADQCDCLRTVVSDRTQKEQATRYDGSRQRDEGDDN
jgi:hypothetical protein